MFDTPAAALHVRPGAGAAAAVTVDGGCCVRARLGAVVASGVWSGQLLAEATGQPLWARSLAPRRGHLLELDPPPGMPHLTHGVMEMSYTK
eukprot:365513-Chlamydomonas_euryale.AAC.8